MNCCKLPVSILADSEVVRGVITNLSYSFDKDVVVIRSMGPAPTDGPLGGPTLKGAFYWAFSAGFTIHGSFLWLYMPGKTA